MNTDEMRDLVLVLEEDVEGIDPSTTERIFSLQSSGIPRISSQLQAFRPRTFRIRLTGGSLKCVPNFTRLVGNRNVATERRPVRCLGVLQPI